MICVIIHSKNLLILIYEFSLGFTIMMKNSVILICSYSDIIVTFCFYILLEWFVIFMFKSLVQDGIHIIPMCLSN